MAHEVRCGEAEIRREHSYLTPGRDERFRQQDTVELDSCRNLLSDSTVVVYGSELSMTVMCGNGELPVDVVRKCDCT